ncbi:MAG: hypothetical protein PHP25_05170 [Candidatus Moranbacteria bacterium]|nr:hypothetical protein [Candidatus Moranbacteria bacterium]
MNEKILKIVMVVYGLLFIVVIVFLAIIFNRTRVLNLPAAGSQPPAGAETTTRVEDEDKGLGNDFSGRISEIGDGYIVAQVEVPDFTQPKDPAGYQPGKAMPFSAFEKKTKDVKVNIDSKTLFSTKKLAEIQKGDVARIISDKAVVINDEMTASVIAVLKQ